MKDKPNIDSEKVKYRTAREILEHIRERKIAREHEKIQRARDNYAKHQERQARKLRAVVKKPAENPPHSSTGDPLYPFSYHQYKEPPKKEDPYSYKNYLREKDEWAVMYDLSQTGWPSYEDWKKQTVENDPIVRTAREAQERVRQGVKKTGHVYTVPKPTIVPEETAVTKSSTYVSPEGEVGSFNFEEYKKAQSRHLAAEAKKLEEAEEDKIHYMPDFTQSWFHKMTEEERLDLFSYYYKHKDTLGDANRPIVVYDIETDDKQHPITLSAAKFMWDPRDGQLKALDTYQRFYKVKKNSQLFETYGIHHLTKGTLEKLRREQGATYAEIYNEDERNAFIEFLGNSVQSGHNIALFDAKQLGIQYLKNGLVDTLDASRNAWPGSTNDLDSVFKRLMGKTMAEAGLGHHLSWADVIAEALVAQQLLDSKGPIGDSLRYVMTHEGTYYGERDSYLGSTIYKSRNRLPEDMMDPLDEDQSADIIKEITSDNASMHYDTPLPSSEDENVKLSDTYNPGEWMKDITNVVSRMSNMTTNMSEVSSLLLGVANSITQSQRGSQVRTAARVSRTEMPEVMEGLGVPQEQQSRVAAAAQALRNERDAQHSFTRLVQLYRQGLWDTDTAKYIRKDLSSNWQGWGPARTDELDLEKDIFQDKDVAYRKQFLRKAVRHGDISKEQADKLELENVENSFDDLADATEKVTQKNKSLLSVLQAIGNIKIYDANQYLNAAKQQVGSSLSAAQGVIPSFLLSPMKRLAAASFNYWDQALTGYTRFKSAWDSGIGNAVGTGLAAGGAAIGTSVGGPVGGLVGAGIGGAVSGVIGGVSQIVGNVQQAEIERVGYGIQNNLNSLGFIIEWVSTPFKALAKAAKLLLGSFTSLSNGLRGFTLRELMNMSSMGNPLTELTGVDYRTYQGSTMLDAASLFNKGSMNSIYENFANQQKAFYTLGEVNQQRLIAASMLGVYDNVYVPHEDTEANYNNMVNKILKQMKFQNKDQQMTTMYLASQIDSNLAGLLHTARLLGVDDISQLTNPSNIINTRYGRRGGMYWRPLSDDEATDMRYSQWEYQAASAQFGYSKSRLANGLWKFIGKDLFNSFNSIVDKAASGDWVGVLREVGNAWDILKNKVGEVWSAIKKTFTGENDFNKDMKNILTVAGLTIVNKVLETSQQIINVWDELMLSLLKKLDPVVDYLRTITIEPKYENNKFSFELHSMGDYLSKDQIQQTEDKIKNNSWLMGRPARVTTDASGNFVEFPYSDDVAKSDKNAYGLINLLFEQLGGKAITELFGDTKKWGGGIEGEREWNSLTGRIEYTGNNIHSYTNEEALNILEYIASMDSFTRMTTTNSTGFMGFSIPEFGLTNWMPRSKDELYTVINAYSRYKEGDITAITALSKYLHDEIDAGNIHAEYQDVGPSDLYTQLSKGVEKIEGIASTIVQKTIETNNEKIQDAKNELVISFQADGKPVGEYSPGETSPGVLEQMGAKMTQFLENVVPQGLKLVVSQQSY